MTTQVSRQAGTDKNAIRPFKVNVPEADLTELRQRVSATKWPERETVTDSSQGVQLATAQKLARYWANGYDWRKCEAKLNTYPQFITEIDGLDIHFAHIRSKHENASEKAFPRLVHYNRVAKGGHFAAWEQPQLFCEEVRAGFRPMRQYAH